MNQRLKELRKQLGLTQQEFADRIGIKRNAVTNYEVGRNEPADMVVSLICREFNVNEQWLRNGTGEMFADVPQDTIDALCQQYRLDSFDRAIIQEYLKLDADSRAVLKSYIRRVVDQAGRDSDQARIDAEVAAYRADLEMEKNPEAGSSASGTQLDA